MEFCIHVYSEDNCIKDPFFKCNFSSKDLDQFLARQEGNFDHFQGQKTRFLDFLKVGLELFRSYLGIVLGLKRPTFRCIFSSKGRYMTSKIQILCQNLGLWEGHFDNFQGQKTRFLDFLKVGLDCSEVI